MSYTEQQLAELYERAVRAEAAGVHTSDPGYELDEVALRLEDTYGALIRKLIDQLRAACRPEQGHLVTSPAVWEISDDEIREIAEKHEAIIVCNGEGDFRDNYDAIVEFGRDLIKRCQACKK